MKGYIGNLEKETLENEAYRKVLYTSHYSQLVLMCLRPGEEIGEEMHGLDQFIRFEQGSGVLKINDEEYAVHDDYGVIIPAGTKHNIVNTSSTKDLKLYTIYSPPAHLFDTFQATKADEIEDQFNGVVSE